MFKKGLILFLLLNSTLARPAAVTKKIEGLYDWKPKNTTITAQNALDINKKIEELKVKIHFTDPDDEISKKLKAELAIQENILKNITITFTGPKITPENLITQKPAKKDYLTEQEFYDFLMTKKPIYRDIMGFYSRTLKDPEALAYYNELILKSKRLKKESEKGFYFHELIQRSFKQDFKKTDPENDWVFNTNEELLKSYEAFLRSLQKPTDKKIPYWQVQQLAKNETYSKRGIPDSLPIEELSWRYPDAYKNYKDNLSRLEDETHRKRDNDANNQDELLKLWFKKAEEKVTETIDDLIIKAFNRAIQNKKVISFYSDKNQSVFNKPDIHIKTEDLKIKKIEKLKNGLATLYFSDQKIIGSVTNLKRTHEASSCAGQATFDLKGKLLSIDIYHDTGFKNFAPITRDEKIYIDQLLKLNKALTSIQKDILLNGATPKSRQEYAKTLRENIASQHRDSPGIFQLEHYFAPEKIDKIDSTLYQFVFEKIHSNILNSSRDGWGWFTRDSKETRYKNRTTHDRELIKKIDGSQADQVTYTTPYYNNPNRKNIIQFLAYQTPLKTIAKKATKYAAAAALAVGLVGGIKYSADHIPQTSVGASVSNFIESYWPSWLTVESGNFGFNTPKDYESYNKGGDSHGKDYGANVKKGSALFTIYPQGKQWGHIPKMYDVPSEEDMTNYQFNLYDLKPNPDKDTKGYLVATEVPQNLDKKNRIPILSSHGMDLTTFELHSSKFGRLLQKGVDYEIYREPVSNLYYAEILNKKANKLFYDATFIVNSQAPNIGEREDIKINKEKLHEKIEQIEAAAVTPLAEALKEVMQKEEPTAVDLEKAFHKASYYSYRKQKTNPSNTTNEFSRFTKFLFEDYLGWQCDTADDAFRKTMTGVVKNPTNGVLKQQFSFVVEDTGGFPKIFANQGHARSVFIKEDKLYEYDATPTNSEKDLLEARNAKPKVYPGGHLLSMNDIILERRKTVGLIEHKDAKDPKQPEPEIEKPEEKGEVHKVPPPEEFEEGLTLEQHNSRKINLEKEKALLVDNPFYKKIPRTQISQDLPTSRALKLGSLLWQYGDRDIDFETLRGKAVFLFPSLAENLHGPKDLKSFLTKAYETESDSMKKMQKLIAERKVKDPKYLHFGNDLLTDSVTKLFRFYIDTDWTPVKKSCKQVLTKLASE
jgi:hypothetical protein